MYAFKDNNIVEGTYSGSLYAEKLLSTIRRFSIHRACIHKPLGKMYLIQSTLKVFCSEGILKKHTYLRITHGNLFGRVKQKMVGPILQLSQSTTLNTLLIIVTLG